MNKPLLTFAAAAALVTGCQTESQWGMTTQLEDMPANVQSAVRQEIGDANITDIDVERRTGNRVYEVTYNENGAEQKLHIREDGTLMSADEAEWFGGSSDELSVETEAAGAERPANAEGARIRGDAYGSRAETEVRGDVGRAQIDTSVGSAGATASANQSGASIEARSNADLDANAGASADANLQLGTKLADVPAAVQQTIKREAANAEIADIDKETRTGRTVYEVSFREAGKNPKLHIAEDGTLLSDREANAFRTGADFNARADYDANHDRIEAKRDVRGGSEALTQGPSAEVDEPAGAEFEAETDVSHEGAGAQISHDADVKAETKFEAEAAGAEAATELQVEGDSADYDATHDRIEAKREVRGGAEALTEGPSAAEAHEGAGVEFEADAAGAEVEAQADVSHESAGAERRFQTEAAGAEAGTAHLRMNDLPQSVQTTIRQHGGSADISRIEKRTVYEVHFKDSSKGTLKIAEDGTMVSGDK